MRDRTLFAINAFVGASLLAALMGAGILAEARTAADDLDRQEIIAQQAYAARMAEAR